MRFYSSLKSWGPHFVFKVILNNIEFCLGFACLFLCSENTHITIYHPPPQGFIFHLSLVLPLWRAFVDS